MDRTRNAWIAIAGWVLVIPAVVFVLANVLRYEAGVELMDDRLRFLTEPRGGLGDVVLGVVLVLGPLIALAIGVASVAGLRVRRTDGAIEATLRVRLRWAHVGLVLVSGGVLAAIGGYLVLENGACWFGTATSC